MADTVNNLPKKPDNGITPRRHSLSGTLLYWMVLEILNYAKYLISSTHYKHMISFLPPVRSWSDLEIGRILM